MPLRDHFRAPLTNRTTWEGFHGQWPAIIVQKLGKELPSRYVAEPRVHVGAQIEIDVTTYENEDSLFSAEPTEATDEGNGGVATTVWAPAKPTLTIETDIPDNAEYEVRVFDAEKNRRLVAAIEIVSPSNKDRPENRQVFVAKCAALLRQGVCVVIVDLVTVRRFNLFGELLELIEQTDPALGEEPPWTYAVSCRWHRKIETKPEVAMRTSFEAWNHSLLVGEPLPTLPLWLSDDFAVPLDLESSYQQACSDLRIP